MKRHGWLVAYVASTVLVNVLWGIVPWVGSFVVGGIFLIRDAAQDRSGRWVLAATGAGIVLSYLMASPAVSLASSAAFAVSEVSDYAINARLMHKPLWERMLITQPLNVVLDTAVFLLGLQMGLGVPWSWGMFGIQVASKSAAVVAVRWVRR